eukprot:m.78504 g.78504  ORF g.78504 m.78504 type:complete len:326 (+) comp11958_c0_seq1:714-1691(+)
MVLITSSVNSPPRPASPRIRSGFTFSTTSFSDAPSMSTYSSSLRRKMSAPGLTCCPSTSRLRVNSPLTSSIQKCWRARLRVTPFISNSFMSILHTPTPALPAPTHTIFISLMLLLVMRIADNIPARATAPVPNVIIETTVVVLKPLQDILGFWGEEILKLDECVWVTELHSRHKLIKKVIIFFPFNSRMPSSHVVLANKSLLTVGSNVQHNWQTTTRVNSCRRCVNCKLANWNGHPINTQVTKSKNTLTICHHNNIHIVLWPVLHDTTDISFVASAFITFRGTVSKVHSTGSSKEQAGFLTSITNSRGVNKRCHFFNMINKQFVK